MNILKHPDPRLSDVSLPVEAVTDELKRLVVDMFSTMYAEGGIGLSAIQVGVDLRLFIMNIDGNPRVFINPAIVWKSPTLQTINEGCLSCPDTFIDVARPAKIVLHALDLDGAPFTIEATGLHATCVQHEMDHLNGITLLG